MRAAPTRPIEATLASFIASFAIVAVVSAPAVAEPGRGREMMKQCVGAALSRLARSKAPESEVGAAVLTHCDKQLRVALADAISAGEAAGCTVESCLDLAKTRTVAEATAAYRQHAAR
jgi:hypothetical protein